MSRTRCLYVSLLIAFAIPAASGYALSQDKVDPQVARIRYSGEIGFSPSAFVGASIATAAAASSTIDGILVRTKIHKLKEPVFVSTELCGGFQEGERLRPIWDEENEFYRVKEFTSYESGPKVVAYEVEYDFFDGKTGEQIGVTRSEFYVDKVGNGAFLINCDVKDFKLTTVPEWVRKTQQNIKPHSKRSTKTHSPGKPPGSGP